MTCSKLHSHSGQEQNQKIGYSISELEVSSIHRSIPILPLCSHAALEMDNSSLNLLSQIIQNWLRMALEYF